MELHGVTWVVKCPTGSEARAAPCWPMPIPGRSFPLPSKRPQRGWCWRIWRRPMSSLAARAGKKRPEKPPKPCLKPVKEGETPWRSVDMLMKIRESRKGEVATLKSIHWNPFFGCHSSHFFGSKHAEITIVHCEITTFHCEITTFHR